MTNQLKIVNRPRGGRGLKAQYPTTTVRVPEVLKQAIQDIVHKFYYCDNKLDDSTLPNVENRASQKLAEIENYIITFKDNNKITKSKVKLYEIVTGLEAIVNAD